MRTTFRFSFIFLCMLAFLAAPRANAQLVISTYYPITVNTTFSQNVSVISGGTLDIAAGVTVTFSSGFSLAVTSGGVINAQNSATIRFDYGSFYTTTGSVTTLASNSSIRFNTGGTLQLMGGTVSCTYAYIRGNAPTYGTSIRFDNGNVLQGTCVIYNMNIDIYDTHWYVAGGSQITLFGYAKISDPTASNTHYIVLNGTLRFENGTFDINTVGSTRISDIFLHDGSELHAELATIKTIPPITAVEPTLILSTESEWLFEFSAGINTQGNIYMENTILDAYDPVDGWNGIYLHDGASTMTLYYTKVLTVNTGAYDAIHLARTDGGTHMLDHCTIANPLNTNARTGIILEGLPGLPLDCFIECTYIAEFDKGVYGGFESNTEINDCEIIYNNVGCHFRENTQSRIHQSSIRENYNIGLLYENSQGNELMRSEVNSNTNYEIYADDNSDLNGDDNNIYEGGVTPIFLVAVYNNSNVNLNNTWWAYYPPNYGTELWWDGTSNLNFSWIYNPNAVDGYLDCAIVYPKAAPRNEAVMQAISAQITAHNYPNPFNPSTQIEFTIPEAMNIVLSVYALNGQRIATIANGYYYEGTHTVTFHAPSAMASGTYMYVLNTPFGAKHGMMVLTK